MLLLQQRSFLADLAPRFSGLIMVIALHLAAVFALMAGLSPKKPEIKWDDLIVKTVEMPRDPVVLPAPRTLEIKDRVVEIPPVQDFSVAPDSISTTITPSNSNAKPIELHKVLPTTAKAPAKGLSAPAYPSDAKKLGEEGAVGLALFLTEEGRVQKAEVDASSGFVRLDQAAALHALKAWRFVPCTENGVPVACWHKIKFRFQLKDL